MDVLTRQLEQLEQAQLVRRTLDEDPSYLFRHALTQEAAYESLLMKTRRQIHRRVAESIERLYPGHLDEQAAILAQHFAESGDTQKTLKYSKLAGDQAFRVYALAEAVMHYRRALDMIEQGASADSGVIIQLYSGLGRAYELSGHYELSLSSAEQMESFARRRGDRAVELASLMQRALIFAVQSPMHDSKRALSLAEEALPLARELGDSAAEAKILWTQCLVYIWSESPVQAIELGEQSLQVAKRFDLFEQMAYTLSDLGYAYSYIGNMAGAIASRRAADSLWRDLGNKAMQSDNLTGLAMLLLTNGSVSEARATIEVAIRLSESIENHWGAAYGLANEGQICLIQGEFENALQLLHQAAMLAAESGAIGPLIISDMALAEVYMQLGAYELGREQANAAIEQAREHLPDWMRWGNAMAIRLLLREQDVAGAADAMREAAFGPLENLVSKTWAKGSLLVTLAMGELALAQGDPALAVHQIDILLGYLRTSGSTVFIPEALYFQATALLAAGRDDEASAAVAEAFPLAESMELRPLRFQLSALAGKIELARGEHKTGERHLAAAHEQIDWIAAHIPAEFRDSFLRVARSYLAGT